MGIDCRIVVKSSSLPEVRFPAGFELRYDLTDHDLERCPGATHDVYTLSRYFGRYYERGHWPSIHYVIIQLMTHPDVEKVWYFGDMHEYAPECTPELLNELTDLWLSRKRDP
jgi:hypothetical protein